MFADDVANCAETANKLQQQTNNVDPFCIDTGMVPSEDMKHGSSVYNNLFCIQVNGVIVDSKVKLELSP
ncbi:hypothetical protein DPMN_171036 [Dreissena polymorpha]|uniref:Uncharacterized protein n=1 Tax=Dreissena polymorpha TaxID=45954 RepID=A0A9D4IDE0_DREPO|nr:hypothetical protein DPMN_171036 [Dreissena polymorpha]